MYVCVCVCAYMRSCVRVCMRACVCSVHYTSLSPSKRSHCLTSKILILWAQLRSQLNTCTDCFSKLAVVLVILLCSCSNCFIIFRIHLFSN